MWLLEKISQFRVELPVTNKPVSTSTNFRTLKFTTSPRQWPFKKAQKSLIIYHRKHLKIALPKFEVYQMSSLGLYFRNISFSIQNGWHPVGFRVWLQQAFLLFGGDTTASQILGETLCYAGNPKWLAFLGTLSHSKTCFTSRKTITFVLPITKGF